MGTVSRIPGRQKSPAAAASGAVSYAGAQSLTTGQTAQARANISGAYLSALAPMGMQVNGDHVVSQEFGDTAITGLTSLGDKWLTDQWAMTTANASVVTVQRSQSTPPSGFTNFLRTTVTTTDVSIAAGDVTLLTHKIEGYRAAKLGWGAASPRGIRIGLWVRCSMTGTFGLAARDAASTRSYVQVFAINAANTWELKLFDFPGDTTGTWDKTNLPSLLITITLSSGSTYQGTAGSWQAANILTTSAQTNFLGTISATFDFTGFAVFAEAELAGFTSAQLETHWPLLFRSFQTELDICQRYFWIRVPNANGESICTLQAFSTTQAFGKILDFPTPMRAAPTVTISANADFKLWNAAAGTNASLTGSPAFNSSTQSFGSGTLTAASAILAAGNATEFVFTTAATGWIQASARM